MNILYKLRSYGYIEIQDDIWFPNLYFNALIKLNKSTGRIKIVDKFPNYEVGCSWLYSTVCYVAGYLVFIPNNSEEIVSYHIEKQKFISVALDSEFIGLKKKYFVNAYVYKHYVYMFPTGAGCIVRYNVLEHTVKYLENCISELIHKMPESFYCFYQQFDMIDEKIYFPFLDVNAVAVFDLRTERAEIRYLDIEGGCSTINYINGYFYLASWNTPRIYRWDQGTGDIKTYQFSENNAGGHIFLGACNIQDKLIFFPEQSDMIMTFCIKSGEMCEEKKINKDDELIQTFFCERKKDGCYALTADKEFMIYNFGYNGELDMSPCFYIDDLYNKKEIADFLIRKGYYYSFFEEEQSLQSYIEIMKNTEQKSQIKKTDYYGEVIFRQIQSL